MALTCGEYSALQDGQCALCGVASAGRLAVDRIDSDQNEYCSASTQSAWQSASTVCLVNLAKAQRQMMTTIPGNHTTALCLRLSAVCAISTRVEWIKKELARIDKKEGCECASCSYYGEVVDVWITKLSQFCYNVSDTADANNISSPFMLQYHYGHKQCHFFIYVTTFLLLVM